MANTLIPKRSSVAAKVPLTTDLQTGEIAINLNDRRLYSKDGSGNVIEIGAGASFAITASEALAAGDLVNVYNLTGSARVRKATAATAGYEAHGFVLNAVASSATALVYFEGLNTAATTLTPGVQFLSGTTAGKTTTTAPTTSGHTVQRVGVAVSSTALRFELGQQILLA